MCIKVDTRMITKPAFKVKLNKDMQFSELKFAVRNTARDISLYFRAIELNYPVETEIPINNFGKWLFGVKGFAGHWKNTPPDENGFIWISLPDVQEARELVGKTLKNLKIQGIVEEFKEV